MSGIITGFHSEYLQEPTWLPSPGSDCEYQIRPDQWIPCFVFGRRTDGRYLCRYVGHTGKLKTGTVDLENLRPIP
jgi:hypothetical protein